jgi:adenosylmethionine-8-amino-7-oxononanoate aminotransferase
MTQDTASLRRQDGDCVWHPFTPMRAYRGEDAPIIAAADGFFLIDTDGRRYLDGISSLWCNVHGHRVPSIDQAIRDQLDRVAHTTLLGLSSVPSIQLARELVERTPKGLNKVFFSDSGATAVEVALKIAYQYHAQKPGREDEKTRRDLFLCLGNAYHGDTIGTVSVGGIALFHGVYRDLLFKTIQVPSPVTLRTPAGSSPMSYLEFCFAELERRIVEHRDRAAGFIIEPIVQGAAGILVHPPGYLRRVRELTQAHGILMIADEVAVGFGRTGRMFACEHEDVRPDLMCLAKGLTGGYLPLAATLATDAIYDAFLADPAAGKTFFHGHTYTGNPLACAAALASLRLFDTNRVLENVRSNAARIAERLAPLRECRFVAEVRQKGVMVGIELVRDRRRNEPFPIESRIGHQVTLAARKRGVIIRPLGDVVVLMPAPAMPSDLIDRLCDACADSIHEVTEGAQLPNAP